MDPGCCLVYLDIPASARLGKGARAGLSRIVHGVAAAWVARVREGLSIAARAPRPAFIDAREAGRYLALPDAEAIAADALAWEAAGRIVIPAARRAALRTAPDDGPRLSAISKCCLVPDLDLAAFRFLGSVRHEDPVRYLHLVGVERGGLLATIDEHSTYLVRIAALALAAARCTVPAEQPVIGMVGAGRLARAVLDAFVRSGRAREIVVASRRPESRDRLARSLVEDGFSRVTAAATPREAAERADLLITATNAETPVVAAAWLKPGATVYGLGDAVEFGADLLVRRERGTVRLVVSNWSECAERADFRRLIAEGRIAESDVDATLADVMAGRAPARLTPRQVVCVRAPGSVALDALMGAWVCAGRMIDPYS
jgi:alanine dehydrogenase